MRKVTWMVVGLAGLSLLLCGSDEVLLAQVETRADPEETVGRGTTDTRVRGTAPGEVRAGASGTEQVAGATGAGTAELRQSVLQLQSQVAQLRQELAQVRAALADVRASLGVGGGGQAGGAQPGVGGAGQTGGTQPVAQPRTPTRPEPPLRAGTAWETTPRGTVPEGTEEPGEAVVNAIYTGTVQSVSNGRLVLRDEGELMTLELGERTRVYRDGQRISARQLESGTRVRVTVDLVGRTDQVTEIVTLPSRQ